MKRMGRMIFVVVLAMLVGSALADTLNLISGSLQIAEPLEFSIQATSTNSSVKEYAVILECETPVTGYIAMNDGIIARFSNTDRTASNKVLPDSGTYRLLLSLEQPATCTQFSLSSHYFLFSEALPAADTGTDVAATVEELNSLAVELAAIRSGAEPIAGARLTDIEATLRAHAAQPCCSALAQSLLDQTAALHGAAAGRQAAPDVTTPVTGPQVNPAEPLNDPAASVGGRQMEPADYRLARLSQAVTRVPRGYQELQVPSSMLSLSARSARSVEVSFHLDDQPSSLMATLDSDGMPVSAYVSGGLTNGALAMAGSAASARGNRETFWQRFWRKREKCLEIQDQRQRERCIDQAFIDAAWETVQEGLGL